MARERVVTRTVMVTNCEVMCVDVLTAQVAINNYKITGTFTTKEGALKVIKKQYETDTFKCVSVQEMTEQEVIYGMKEVDFIRLAKIMDENRKFVDDNGNEVEEETEA